MNDLTHPSSSAVQPDTAAAQGLDETDRALIEATQGGLPIVAEPYAQIASRLGITQARVMDRLRHMKATAIIRRIAAVPNHYALGYRANAMTVWDVPDELVDGLGQHVGQLAFVSHCYRRRKEGPTKHTKELSQPPQSLSLPETEGRGEGGAFLKRALAAKNCTLLEL